MTLNMLKCKIHRASVTMADPDYIGSITIDRNLMDIAGIKEYEQVHVADIDNGARIITYAIPGEAGSGVICVNGAGAKLIQKGHKVIIMCYCLVDEKEIESFTPKIVFVDENNAPCDKENCR